jgi:hypothetical protein
MQANTEPFELYHEIHGPGGAAGRGLRQPESRRTGVLLATQVGNLKFGTRAVSRSPDPNGATGARLTAWHCGQVALRLVTRDWQPPAYPACSAVAG